MWGFCLSVSEVVEFVELVALVALWGPYCLKVSEDCQV